MKKIETFLYRIFDNGDDTIGFYMFDKDKYVFTCEDEHRLKKLPGETRIWGGRYRLKLRKELTPLTTKYRELYSFFKFHIQIMDVKDFQYVYLHIGNSDKNSDACVLVGDQPNNNSREKGFIRNSVKNYKYMYEALYPYLEDEDNYEVYINIIEEGEFRIKW